MDREARHAAVHGVAKSQIWLSDWTELNNIEWKKLKNHTVTKNPTISSKIKFSLKANRWNAME